MSHLNILNISRELTKINSNIKNISSGNNYITDSLQDLNEIKANKVDIEIILDQFKDELTIIDKKLLSINNEVSKLLDRDMDYVNKNTKEFSNFLRTNLNLQQKKINIIVYVLECNNPQDFLLLNYNDLKHFEFAHDEFKKIQSKCRQYIEDPESFF